MRYQSLHQLDRTALTHTVKLRSLLQTVHLRRQQNLTLNGTRQLIQDTFDAHPIIHIIINAAMFRRFHQPHTPAQPSFMVSF